MATLAEQLIREGEKRGEELGLKRGEELGLKRGEELGLDRGMKHGLLNGLALALELRFGEAGLSLLPEIKERADVGTLKALMEHVKRAASPDELRRVYAKS